MLQAKVLNRLRQKSNMNIDSMSDIVQPLPNSRPVSTHSHVIGQLEKLHVWDWKSKKLALPLFLDVLGQRQFILRALQLLRRGYKASPTLTLNYLIQLMAKDILEKTKTKTKRFSIVGLDQKQSDTVGWQLTKEKFEFLHQLLTDLRLHWPRFTQPLDLTIVEIPYQFLCHSDSYTWLHYIDPQFAWLFYMTSTAPGKKMWVQVLKSKIPPPLFYALGSFRSGRNWLEAHHILRPNAMSCHPNDEKKWVNICLVKSREREENETIQWYLTLMERFDV
ncbi:hypothetical protein HMI55_004359 [Coelomomyces lativittatus]|nr:hypothetical protein HMI55_004359 [Coelomomyces lativittatus]